MQPYKSQLSTFFSASQRLCVSLAFGTRSELIYDEVDESPWDVDANQAHLYTLTHG